MGYVPFTDHTQFLLLTVHVWDPVETASLTAPVKSSPPFHLVGATLRRQASDIQFRLTNPKSKGERKEMPNTCIPGSNTLVEMGWRWGDRMTYMTA